MFQVFFMGFTTGCLAGFVMEWMFKKKQITGVENRTETMDDEVLPVASNEGNAFKLVLILNAELKMGDGKIMAQCAHATVGTYQTYYKSCKMYFEAWERQGKQISVYKVSDTNTLKALSKSADDMHLLSCLIRDAGRTQIAAGSQTVLAVGPAEEANLDPLDTVNRSDRLNDQTKPYKSLLLADRLYSSVLSF